MKKWSIDSIMQKHPTNEQTRKEYEGYRNHSTNEM